MFKRVNSDVVPFSINSPAGNRYAFGTTDVSNDIDVNYNENIKKGFGTGPNEFPELEDFNALMFTGSYLAAYLYQAGIPEWNDKQKYYINSIAMGSDGNLYKSLTGTEETPNVNNNPTLAGSVSWKSILSEAVELTGNQTVAGVKNFTSSPIVPAPTTDFQVATKKYVDDLNKVVNSDTVDFNTIVSEGLYPAVVAGSSANGMGTPYYYYYVVVYKYSDMTLTQVAYPYSTGIENKEVWTRTRYAGTWGRWTKVGGGHISQVNTISNPYKAVGASWGKINFSNAEIETNSNEITYLTGSSSNFHIKSSGEYEFNLQIYVEPPLSGSAVSVYLGLFDLGSDGLIDTLIAVANQDVNPGQHPSLNLSKIVKVTTSARYYTLKWYFLDGNRVQTTLNLQTSSIYCWANCKRI